MPDGAARSAGGDIALHVGDVAPGFTLPAVDHPAVALCDILAAGDNALLVFLRYLG